MAKSVNRDRLDPTWPEIPGEAHPVSELTADMQGSLSPFGDVEFPQESVPYVQHVTEINR